MLTTRSALTALSMSQHSLMKSRCVLASCRAAVELLQALGGLLEAQARATQELPCPGIARAHVETRCVEPFIDQASDGHRTQAQDVGDLHYVLAEPRHVCG